MDYFEVSFLILRNSYSALAIDEITWLAQNFNLQINDLAWNVADHYNTGKEIFYKLCFSFFSGNFLIRERFCFPGNDLFEKMLDPYMQYSCGYWKDAKDLNTAQLAKLDFIAQKLKLQPGMTVLDLGCGFGGLAKYLAENYGVSVVGCTISKKQVKLDEKLCKGLPVKFLLCDYQKMKLIPNSIESLV